MNPIYVFLLNMWVMRKIDEAYVGRQVAKGNLTEEEGKMIISTPQKEQA